MRRPSRSELCRQMAADDPDRYLLNMTKKLRTGRIFLDYLRNDRMATAVAPLSPRLRQGATVSMPLQWSQLRAGLDPRRYTIRTVPALLGKSAAWQEYCELRTAAGGCGAAAGHGQTHAAKGRMSGPIEPMEARLVEALPAGEGWQFEPKWDGFRCLACRAGEAVDVAGQIGQVARALFPGDRRGLAGVAAAAFRARRRTGHSARRHAVLRCAAGRGCIPPRAVSAGLPPRRPAIFILFDCLMDATGEALMAAPFGARREALERFFDAVGVQPRAAAVPVHA